MEGTVSNNGSSQQIHSVKSKASLCNQHAPVSSPDTAFGMSALVQSPVPSCPKSLLPQHKMLPFLSRAHACSSPAATETAPECMQVDRSGKLKANLSNRLGWTTT